MLIIDSKGFLLFDGSRARDYSACVTGTGAGACAYERGFVAVAARVAQLFRDNPDIEDFRERVIALRGDFPFDSEEMQALGDAYFERYPDCFSNRSCQDVALGYRMVRICVIEKLLGGLEERTAAGFREMFYNVSVIPQAVARLCASIGAERFTSHHEEFCRRLGEIQLVIDSLPIGMTKERFIGGVSHIHNVLYIIKSAMKGAGG